MDESLTQVVERQLKKTYEEGGIAACQQLIQSQLTEWQGMPMNIAVTGLAGAGKSSLINAFLGLTEDVGGARVSSSQGTSTIEQYNHPDNENLIFSDLPGVATPDFPQKSYMDDIDADKYDFFILVTSKRFLEIDVWLSKELTKRNKGYFFVRTHMANDVANDKRAHPQRKEHEIVAEIREGTQAQLGRLWTTSPTNLRVFLIDSYELDNYDFSDLQQQLIANFPKLKKEALLLTLRTRNAAMIDQKAECLRSRVWKAAAVSGGVAAVPIPGTSFVADITILVHETKFYFQQFGLDPQSLERLAQTTGAQFSELNAAAMQAFGVEILSLSPLNLFKFISTLGISLALFQAESVMEVAVSAIPIVGTVLASTMSFLTTAWLLGEIIRKMHIVAKEIYDTATVQKCTA